MIEAWYEDEESVGYESFASFSFWGDYEPFTEEDYRKLMTTRGTKVLYNGARYYIHKVEENGKRFDITLKNLDEMLFRLRLQVNQ